MGLLIVIGLLFGLIWALKRLGLNPAGKRTGFYKLLAIQPLGPKEKIALIEIGDTWLLIGMTSHNINTLHTMPKNSIDLDSNSPNAAAAFAKLLERVKSPQVKS